MEVFRTRLRSELDGEVLFDDFSLGQYSTDASIYQITPLGIAIPNNSDDALRALEIAADAGVAILPRGAGTSQCGQAVGEAQSPPAGPVGHPDHHGRTKPGVR